MRRLERPAHRAGRGIERHDRAREALRLGRAMSAVIVRRRVAGRNVDQAERIVGAEHAPRVRRAARVRLSFRRRCQHVGTAEIPRPQQAAAERIEAAHDARRLLRFDVVGDPAAEHRDAFRERRRRSHVVEAGLHVAHAVEQRHFAVRAEVAAALAGLRIDRDQSRVRRRREDSFGTVGRRLGRFEIRDAATRRGEANLRVLQLRIEAPALSAGVGIERGDDVAREADIERVADLQRRRLERAADAGAIGPRDLQLADVRRIDLVERRIARARGSAAPMLPIARSDLRIARAAGNGSVGYGSCIADSDADRSERGDREPADAVTRAAAA